MQFIQNPWFQKFLVTHSDLYWVSGGTSFLEPARNEGNVVGSSCFSTPLIERFGSPEEVDSVGAVLISEFLIIQQGLEVFSKVNFSEIDFLCFFKVDFTEWCFGFIDFVGGDGVDWGVEVEGGYFWVFLFDVDWGWVVVDCVGYLSGSVVVEVRECDFVLCPDGVSDYDFADVVELIPIFIEVG